MMWSNHGGWGAGAWIAMGLVMLLFWGLLISLVVWSVGNFRGRSTRSTGEHITATDTADEMLAGRFARGEIDEGEFTRSRALLHQSVGGPK